MNLSWVRKVVFTVPLLLLLGCKTTEYEAITLEPGTVQISEPLRDGEVREIDFCIENGSEQEIKWERVLKSCNCGNIVDKLGEELVFPRTIKPGKRMNAKATVSSENKSGKTNVVFRAVLSVQSRELFRDLEVEMDVVPGFVGIPACLVLTPERTSGRVILGDSDFIEFGKISVEDIPGFSVSHSELTSEDLERGLAIHERWKARAAYNIESLHRIEGNETSTQLKFVSGSDSWTIEVRRESNTRPQSSDPGV